MRRIVFTPRAQREMRDIIASYRSSMGLAAAAKTARTLRAGLKATARISREAATRPDLPEGYFRVVAKAHLIIFQVEGDVSRIVRIVHGARDIPALLAPEAK